MMDDRNLFLSTSGTTSSDSYSSRALLSWEEYSAFGAFSKDADRDKHYCVPYTDEEFDQFFNTAGKAGRGFGVVASLLSGIVMTFMTVVFLFLEQCVGVVWKTCLVLITLAAPSQFLTFLAMLVENCQDADKCFPGIAGYASIIAGVLFIVIAILLGPVGVGPPAKPLVSISDMRSRNMKIR